MNTKVRLQIEALCRLTPTVESCGFVILRHDGLHLMPCANAAPNPAEDFEIAASDHASAHAQGRVLYVWHSHPVAGGFSEADIDAAEESLIPQKLFSMPDSTWHEYIPKEHRLPLEGRAWAWGEADCLSLIRDYYRQEHGISLGDYDRDEDTPALGHMVMDNLVREGFVKILSKSVLHKHDMLIMRTNGSPQHMVVFLGNSRVLHHPLHALSKIDMYNGAWQRRLECIVRHRDL